MRKGFYKISAAGCVLGMTAGLLTPAPAGVQAKTKSAGKWTAKISKSTLYMGWTSGKKIASVKVRAGKKAVAAKKLKFKSSNKKVAEVSVKGKITAVKAGKAVITVTSKADKKWKKKFKVTVKNYKMVFAEKEVMVTLTGTSDKTTEKLKLYGVNGAVTYTSSNKEVATVSAAGKVTAYKFGQTVIMAKNKKGKTASCTVTVMNSARAIHDPSVYRDPKSGKYYTFGSHLMGAASTNLIGWSVAANATGYSSATTLFTQDYTKEFAQAYAYTMPDGASQNAWAPDIIYNKKMDKYCMYMSIVDGSTKCSIAMAVSDKPDGPYKYQGMIVCSGMKTDGSDIDRTNVAEALGISDADAKKSKYASLGSNSPDCIDATVFYDHKGKLWMVYGSFTTTGGIRLLKLDPDTGLRGENYKDSGDGAADALSTEDPYYGKKIANSNGEGPYIQMVPSDKSSTGYYYYLWISTGNLQYYGGYNMRMMRSENPDGPYTDPAGNEAIKDKQKYALGLRVMDNYQFSFMDAAFVSQGGNSATEDGNGKTFIQFHARTSRSDSFTMRTHQTFQNEDGWLVTTPYEYNGETIADSYAAEDVAGDYEFLYHRTSFAKTTTSNKDVLKSVRVTLEKDGNVTGAYTGKWSLKGHYLTIEMEGKTYKGVVLEQYEQTDSREKVMVFTAAGSDNRTVWGSKMHKSDAQAVAYDSANLTIPDAAAQTINADEDTKLTVTRDFELPAEGMFGSAVTWTSGNDAVRVDGKTARVTRGAKDTEVTLTALVTKGSSKKNVSVKIIVAADKLEVPGAVDGSEIKLADTLAGENVTWTTSDASVITAEGKVTQPETGYSKAALTAKTADGSYTFPVVVLPKKQDNVLYAEDYSTMVSDVAIATTWTSKDKQNCLYVESDATHDSFIKFAGGNTSKSQGAQTSFGLNDKKLQSYVVEYDIALDAGTRDTTEFVLTGSDVKFNSDDTNAGVESGYILKLSAEADSTEWSVNGSKETYELPLTWVHVTAAVDPASGKAAVRITDDTREYFGGEVTISGSGQPGGLYLKWACIQSLISVDNVKATD